MLSLLPVAISLFLLLTTSLGAEGREQPCLLKQPAKVKWKGRVRVRSLHNVDDFLNFALPPSLKSYALAQPGETTVREVEFPQAREFAAWHGYFSPYDPLVGRVSKKKDNVSLARCLLGNIAQATGNRQGRAFAIEEALTKVVAYRDLREQDEIFIPTEEGECIPYRVDHLFDLWRGMPAFGLVPEGKGVPILLFRGTDFSLDSERGWASLMSDVDIAGPGLTAFTKARQEIHAWLEKVAERGVKAKVMGFSLGGSLAAYTFLYENPWVNSVGSVAFNPPGFSENVLQEWNRLPEERRKGFRLYVTRGDVVSKVGKLFGTVYELSCDSVLKPLKAHTLFFSSEGTFVQSRVDVEKENSSR